MNDKEIKASDYFLFRAEKEWKGLWQFPKDINSKPWGVWVREYESISEECSGFSVETVPKSVWFLDKHGYSKKEVSEFQRFLLIQSEQTWCGRVFPEFGNPLWSGNGRVFHEIGLAAFAKIENTSKSYYFEYIWGGRFGRGYRIDLAAGFDTAVWKTIWIS